MSHAKKKLNSWSLTVKRLQLFWVTLRRGSKKKLNSLSHLQRVQFCESCIYKEDFDFFSLFFFYTRFNSSNHISEKRFNSVSYIKIVQFFESYLEKRLNSSQNLEEKKAQFLTANQKKRFNSLRHTKKGFNSLRHNFWKKKKLSSLRVIKKKKSPILWIKFQKHKFQVFASGTILWVIWKINSLRNFSQKKIFKSFENMNHMQKKMFNSLSRIEKKEGSILWLWVVYIWQRFNSLNHIQKEVQFFESHLKKGSILWDTFRKKGSILWVILRKKINSLNRI